MDAKKAKSLIEQLCQELDQQRAQSGLASFARRVRPLGLGLMLSLSGGALGACGEDSGSKKDAAVDMVTGADSAYGVPDGLMGSDAISGVDAAYGVPDGLAPQSDGAADQLVPSVDSAYGLPDGE